MSAWGSKADPGDRSQAPVAVDRFVGFGHRRIGLASNGHDLMRGHILLAGYRRALARHGLEFDPTLVRSEEMAEAGGYRLAGALLGQGPLPRRCWSATSGWRSASTAG
ncbi:MULTISPECIES: substrate-binding domain-containing protein [Inquilinus]|uniref:DNA-binding LacI/PurR family transcriptional regulator n=1 Tax=Inquilinus ginsengisoli TaxID=363840 RepID=A0ABU1JSG9_9PROT|nr:substrate-binding domain-containing protein [Inquilinus ginsengisoli]MDR6291565.1 DNA-binding LacI/PurR family transcriptional regulator [Inquilinus ginsengisoli]